MEFLKSVSQDSETGDTSREKFVIPEDGTRERSPVLFGRLFAIIKWDIVEWRS